MSYHLFSHVHAITIVRHDMNREKPGNSFYKKKDIANRMLRRNLGGP